MNMHVNAYTRLDTTVTYTTPAMLAKKSPTWKFHGGRLASEQITKLRSVREACLPLSLGPFRRCKVAYCHLGLALSSRD